MPPRKYLPLALNMDSRSAVVVGGGEPAFFKAVLLVDFGISTTVLVEPTTDVDTRLQELAEAEAITLHDRGYNPKDLEGHYLAVVATGDRVTDYRVESDARARGLLVNVVDDPAHCDFFASAYVRHGPISIAVNSGGASPGFTAALKDDVASHYGPEIEEHLSHYLKWRKMVQDLVPTFHEREQIWRDLRAAGLYDLLRAKGPDAALKLIESRLDERPSSS